MKFYLAILALFLLVSNSQQINAIGGNNEACVACQKWSNFIWNITENLDNNLLSSISKICNDYSNYPGQATYRWCQHSVYRMFDLFKQGWKKDQVCYDIKACTGISVNNLIGPLYNDDEKKPIGDETDCKFCIFVAQQVKDLVTGSPFQLEIKVHLEDACHYLGGFENECLNLVDNYVDTMFSFIKENFKPNDLCQSIRVCPKKSIILHPRLSSFSQMINLLPANMEIRSPAIMNSSSIDPAVTCFACKFIVERMQQFLKDGKTQDEMLGLLLDVCDLMGSNKNECRDIVQKYFEQLITIVTEDISPETACLMLGLCQPPSQIWKNLLLHQKNEIFHGNAICVECELIAHFIQNEMYNYKNEKQVEEFIKNHLCKQMRFIINEPNCRAFIDQYGPIILQTIAQDLFDPDTLCYKEIKVCHKALGKSRANRKKLPMDQNAGHVRCTICQSVVQSLSDVQNIEIEMNPIIVRSCRRFQDKQRSECALMVRSFGVHFMDMIGRYESPRQICESVDLCASGTVQLVGGHKCTYGPSYWCHSTETANACKAYEYCHQNMWESSK